MILVDPCPQCRTTLSHRRVTTQVARKKSAENAIIATNARARVAAGLREILCMRGPRIITDATKCRESVTRVYIHIVLRAVMRRMTLYQSIPRTTGPHYPIVMRSLADSVYPRKGSA